MTYPKIGTPPRSSCSPLRRRRRARSPHRHLGDADCELVPRRNERLLAGRELVEPDVLQLYFSLAAEAYARQTEGGLRRARGRRRDRTVGTASGRLGTAGTESFAQWRSAVSAGMQGIYTATGGRHRTNTLYLSAALLPAGDARIRPDGADGADREHGRRGDDRNFFGLRVVGSCGFDQDVAIIETRGAPHRENPGSPVEMRGDRAEHCGLGGGAHRAFNAAVFDENRFYHGTHL